MVVYSGKFSDIHTTKTSRAIKNQVVFQTSKSEMHLDFCVKD